MALHAWQGPAVQRLDKRVQCDAKLQTIFSDNDSYALHTETQKEGVPLNSPEIVQSPTREREEKISTFKTVNTAENRLSLLMDYLEKCSITNQGDTDLHRASLLVRQSAVRRALDLFSSLQKEIAILRFVERPTAKGVDPRVKADQARERASTSVLPYMPSIFRFVNQIEKERDKVFRPSHSLPKYSNEQWGENEAQILTTASTEKRKKYIAAKRRKEEEQSDGDEAVNRQTIEASKWDYWKDKLNKGSGNSIW
ncbi:unnamed protein product [Agarophyton chilense]